MLKRTFVALSIGALSVTGLVAQENATFTLRSGERISGQLVDMGGAGFTVRVNGQDRQIPTGDMALIDFAGSSMSQSDWDRVRSGQHIIWLRNGQTISGQITDVGGTTPLRISVRADGNDRDITSSEISRIAFARPDNAVPTTGGGQGQGVTVSARQAWTPTGITVRRGEWITFRADGEIRLSGDSNDKASASGVVSQRFDTRAPLPKTLAGALIGRIGSGEPFGIGTENRIQAPDAGQLFLGINESNLSDNDGEFRVTIDRAGTPSRR